MKIGIDYTVQGIGIEIVGAEYLEVEYLENMLDALEEAEAEEAHALDTEECVELDLIAEFERTLGLHS